MLYPVQPAVFLDRDNTLIHNDGDLGDPNAVRLVDGVPAGLKQLRQAGFALVVITNQGGVARGKFTEEDVDAVHQRIAVLVDEQSQSTHMIERFYYCPYHPEATVPEYRRDHPWRKPHPGMILQAAHDMGLDLANSWLVGDQERDIHAGRAAGCRTVLVARDGKGLQSAGATETAPTFADAVQKILRVARTSPPAGPRAQPAAGAAAARGGAAGDTTPTELSSLKRAIGELTEEVRSERMRRAEFSFLRMAAVVCQMLVVLLALLGLLQLDNHDVFFKWMMGAALVQMLTMTLLLMDLKG